MRVLTFVRRVVFWWGVMTCGLAAQAPEPLTVRVESRGGAPRLLVNGHAVRARMFFGGPGANPIPACREGSRVQFDFTASADAAKAGTLHFRFGQKLGDVWIDDVQIVEVATGRAVLPLRDFEEGPPSFAADWRYWPPEPPNNVGIASVVPGCGRGGSAGLHVRQTVPADGRWPDSHVYHRPDLDLRARQAYRVSFWCRADPPRDLTVALYRPGNTFTYLGGPPSRFESQIRLAAGAGVDFVTFIVPTPWPAPGEPEDWTAVDVECDRVLHENPRALLLPRFGLEPPPWWAQAHADQMMTWEDGSRRANAVPSSPIYLREAAERLEALVRHLEQKYGAHMAGYHPCGQNTGEWFYEETWGGLLNGYAPADRVAWRAWLRARYGVDPVLREAWGDPAASIDLADVPSPADRRATPNGMLRDPHTERRLVDFALCQQDGMADCVRALAAAARRASHGRKLVVVFYGYGFEFGPTALGPATSGHYALRRILDCADIDIVCSPISYGDRGLGETGPVMSAAESVALAGKMWLQEDDTRTHESPDAPDAIARLATRADTLEVLTRNVANAATRNQATWWMDLGMSGWFDDPALWDLQRRLAALDAPFLRRPIPFRPEVVAVLDERSAHLAAPAYADAFGALFYQARWQFGRMGTPYGQVLLEDVIAGRTSAKLNVFLDAWWLTSTQRKALRTVARRSTCLWCYAPACYDDDGPDPEGMRELTTFRLERVSPGEAWAIPTHEGRRRGLTRALGLHRSLAPLFAATDAGAGEVLAVYDNGAPAVVLRKTARGVSIFSGVPGLTPELLRLAAQAAGVHIYANDDTCIHANGPIVAVTATRDGPVTLDLGTRGIVRDALTGVQAGRGPRLTLPLQKGDTRVLRIR